MIQADGGGADGRLSGATAGERYSGSLYYSARLILGAVLFSAVTVRDVMGAYSLVDIQTNTTAWTPTVY